MKKISLMFLVFFCSLYFTNKVFAISFEDLFELACENNSEILAAQKDYDLAVLAAKGLNGTYAPSLSVSATSSFENEKNIIKDSDHFSSTVTLSQPLPGGTSISLSGNYDFTKLASLSKETLINQTPTINLTLSQSLLPFWTQGKFKDPSSLSASLQERYYQNKLLYTQKTVLKNLMQNYVSALISLNECEFYKNSIELMEESLAAEKELKASNNTNQIRITEIENNRLNYCQNLIASKANYENYIQNIKMLCAYDFDSTLLEADCSQNYLSSSREIIQQIKNKTDPLAESYKLETEILNANRTLQKQNDAPALSLSIQPNWKPSVSNQSEWADGIKNIGKPQSWNVSLGVNLSPSIASLVSQNKKKFELEYDKAKKNYDTYLNQKNFVSNQYQNILNQYRILLDETEKLYMESKAELTEYEDFYNMGRIAKIDFLSIKVKVENCQLSLMNLKLNVWLYENFIIQS